MTLPYVWTSADLLARKIWSAGPKVWEMARPERKAGWKRCVAFHLKHVAERTRHVALKWPHVKSHNRFHQNVIMYTLGHGVYEAIPIRLKRVYADLYNVAKEFEKRGLSEKEDDVEYKLLQEDFLETLQASVLEKSAELEEIAKVAQTLRHLPDIDLDGPLVALIGAPNVGKSSLVHALSTGKPEIANYPFTTRRITMGHLHFPNNRKLQVADTPGLWYRADSKRNDIEKLAMTMISDTSAILIFVLDVSETGGMSLVNQLALRTQVQKVIHEKSAENGTVRIWIDVASKCDLVSSEQLSTIATTLAFPNLLVSTVTGTGLGNLGDRLFKEFHALPVLQKASYS